MKKLSLMLLSAALAAPAMGATGNAVPSCYDSKLGIAPAAAEAELFVLVDQTTVFDPVLQQQVATSARPFMRPGYAFSVLTFSAFSQGRYTQVLAAGTIEPAIGQGQRDDISKPVLTRFDACAKRQPQLAMQAIGSALRNAFAGASSDLAKSDVMGSIKSISARVKQSSARRKVVLIASDMLENSSVTGFYGNNGQSVRLIDPDEELKLAAANELFGDFGGARIYVIGAGLLAPNAGKNANYRDPKTMRALGTFWNGYFQKSHATVVEIGQPALLNGVQ